MTNLYWHIENHLEKYHSVMAGFSTFIKEDFHLLQKEYPELKSLKFYFGINAFDDEGYYTEFEKNYFEIPTDRGTFRVVDDDIEDGPESGNETWAINSDLFDLIIEFKNILAKVPLDTYFYIKDNLEGQYCLIIDSKKISIERV